MSNETQALPVSAIIALTSLEPPAGGGGGGGGGGADFKMIVWDGTTWSATLPTFKTDTFTIADNADVTKTLNFNADNITTGALRTCVIPDSNSILPGYLNDSVVLGSTAINENLGADNVFVGHLSGINATQDGNVGIGSEAGRSLTTGFDNVLLGKTAGTAITTGANNVLIGSGTALDADRNGCIVLGTLAVSSAAIGTAHVSIGSTIVPIATSATVGAAGVAAALPATPASYLHLSINDTVYKIPMYLP